MATKWLEIARRGKEGTSEISLRHVES